MPRINDRMLHCTALLFCFSFSFPFCRVFLFLVLFFLFFLFGCLLLGVFWVWALKPVGCGCPSLSRVPSFFQNRGPWGCGFFCFSACFLCFLLCGFLHFFVCLLLVIFKKPKKPRENQKHSRKPKKPRENQKKPKKTKKPFLRDSSSRQPSSARVPQEWFFGFFGFFGFLEVFFWFFGFSRVFLVFWVFSSFFGFLEVFLVFLVFSSFFWFAALAHLHCFLGWWQRNCPSWRMAEELQLFFAMSHQMQNNCYFFMYSHPTHIYFFMAFMTLIAFMSFLPFMAFLLPQV